MRDVKIVPRCLGRTAPLENVPLVMAECPRNTRIGTNIVSAAGRCTYIRSYVYRMGIQSRFGVHLPWQKCKYRSMWS